jgi:hypothetical protein
VRVIQRLPKSRQPKVDDLKLATKELVDGGHDLRISLPIRSSNGQSPSWFPLTLTLSLGERGRG